MLWSEAPKESQFMNNFYLQKQPPALVPTQSVAQQQAPPPTPQAIIGLDPSKIVPIQITYVIFTR